MKKIKLLMLLCLVFFFNDSYGQKGDVKSEKISTSRQALGSDVEPDGFEFYGLNFKYQFVNCGGDVQMGINYDKNASFTGFRYKGSSYSQYQLGDKLWPKSNQVELKEITADLYYGNSRLGNVRLTYIVGNFAGCFGETFDVLKQVGENPSAKEYKDNINKLSLRKIVITKAGASGISDYNVINKIKSL